MRLVKCTFAICFALVTIGANATRSSAAEREFQFDHVRVHRYYNFHGTDKSSFRDFKPEDEILKSIPASIEVGAGRSWYGYKGQLAVEAPKEVREGKSVVIRATASHAWELKLDKPSTDLGIAGNVNTIYLDDPKALKATVAQPLNSGRQVLTSEKSRNVTPGKDVLLFGREWEKDGVHYIRFSVAATAAIGGDGGGVETTWVYRHVPTPLPKVEPKPFGRVSLAVNGAPSLAERFTVTATLERPSTGQTVRLELPPGLERVSGKDVEVVPAPGGGTDKSTVSWQVQATKPGKFAVVVRSGPVTSAVQQIIVEDRAKPAGAMTLSVPEAIEVGKVFVVTARFVVSSPNETVTLELPSTLELVEGPAKQTASAPAGGEGVIVWRVRSIQPGPAQVRVRADQGGAVSRPIAIGPAAVGGDSRTRRKFSALDAERALKMWCRVIPAESDYDLNGDGTVDSRDATLILQQVAGGVGTQP